jgi:hypothetical protein
MRKIFGTHPLFSILKLYDRFIKDGNFLTELEANFVLKDAKDWRGVGSEQKNSVLSDLRQSLNREMEGCGEKNLEEKRFKNCRKLIKLFYSLLLKDKVDLLPVYLEYLFHCVDRNSLFSKVAKAENKKTYNLQNTLVVASFMKSLTESLRRREEGYSISERELFKLEQIIDQKFTMTVHRLHLGFWLKNFRQRIPKLWSSIVWTFSIKKLTLMQERIVI